MEERMATEAIGGSCLCGTFRFEVMPPLAAFRYCHCSRCRKASGSAHAANAFVPEAQFTWLAGDASVKRFDLPGAKRFAVSFCQTCGTRVPPRVAGSGNMLVPAGLLDGDPTMRPENSILWGSKAAWYVAPDEHPRFEQYP
jgi:hypothetical protein